MHARSYTLSLKVRVHTSAHIRVYTPRTTTFMRIRHTSNLQLTHFPSLPAHTISQPSPIEDILYRRMHVAPRREQRAHVLRRVREAHVLQLLFTHHQRPDMSF